MRTGRRVEHAIRKERGSKTMKDGGKRKGEMRRPSQKATRKRERTRRRKGDVGGGVPSGLVVSPWWLLSEPLTFELELYGSPKGTKIITVGLQINDAAITMATGTRLSYLTHCVFHAGAFKTTLRDFG